MIGSTSTVSFIFDEILSPLSTFAIFFCIKNRLLNLINNLDLKFFFIFNSGESTGPSTSMPLMCFNLALIYKAPCILELLLFEDMIIAISLINGGNVFFSLNESSFFKSSSDLFLIISLSVKF